MARIPLILGSQSPRRRELLAMLLPSDAFHVEAPDCSDEPPFDPSWTSDEIEAHLLRVARGKNEQVRHAAHGRNRSVAILTADTVVVGFDHTQHPVVLGKPPDNPVRQAEVVRNWFLRYYLGREHLVKSAVCLTTGDAGHWEAVVTTRVRMDGDAADVEWYLQTGEPVGKAGGYAIQEAGAMFVSSLEGSLTNVIGLPLRETRELLRQSGLLNR